MLNAQSLPAGREQFEAFSSRVNRRDLIQYDYRDSDGELFSTVAPSLEEARARRDTWLKVKGRQ